MATPTKVPTQIEKIRKTGEVNMLNYNGVQRLAFEMDCHELVVWMEDVGEKGYGEYVLTGNF